MLNTTDELTSCIKSIDTSQQSFKGLFVVPNESNVEDYKSIINQVIRKENKTNFEYQIIHLSPPVISFFQDSESIAILLRILKLKFPDLKYSKLVTCATDFLEILRCIYLNAITEIEISAITCRSNRLTQFQEIWRYYKNAISSTQEHTAVTEHIKTLHSTCIAVDRIFWLETKRAPKIFQNIKSEFKNKSTFIQSCSNSYHDSIKAKFELHVFQNDFEEAEAISYIATNSSKNQESVLIISDSKKLTKLINLLLNKTVPKSASKQKLIELFKDTWKMIKNLKTMDLLLVIKNPLVDISASIKNTFEAFIKTQRYIAPDAYCMVKTFLQNFGTDENLSDFNTLLKQIIDSRFELKKAFFNDFVELHKKIFLALKVSTEDSDYISCIFSTFSSVSYVFSEQLSTEDYLELIESLLNLITNSQNSSDKIKLSTSNEIPALEYDLIIVSGLNDGEFPKPFNNFWLSEALATELKFSKYGSSLSDFYNTISFAKKRCIFTRNSKYHSKIQSRFLNAFYSDFFELSETCSVSESIDSAKNKRTAELIEKYPTCCTPVTTLTCVNPPISARPKEFTANDIQYLIKNPYQLYVKYILKLKSLNFFNFDSQGIYRSDFLHHSMEHISKLAMDNCNEIENLVNESIKELDTKFLWAHSTENIFRVFSELSISKQTSARYSLFNVKGSITLGEFKINSLADRIDLYDGDLAAITDYRTGNLPSTKQIKSLDSSKLILEGLILTMGGFEGLTVKSIKALEYWGLLNKPKIKSLSDEKEILESIEQIKIRATELLNKSMNTPYKSYIKKYEYMYKEDAFLLSRASEVLGLSNC